MKGPISLLACCSLPRESDFKCPTVLRRGLPEGSPRVKHNPGEDVLKTGDQEKNGVFRVSDIGLHLPDLRWNVPGVVQCQNMAAFKEASVPGPTNLEPSL